MNNDFLKKTPIKEIEFVVADWFQAPSFTLKILNFFLQLDFKFLR